MTATVLIVEDDDVLGRSLEQRLRLEGWDPMWVRSIGEAERVFARRTPDVVMCDIRLPDGDGETLMRHVFERVGAVPTLFMTAFGNVDQAVRLVRLGARDYIAKPFDIDEVIEKLAAASSSARPANAGDAFASFGLSPATIAVRRILERVADVDLPILVLGETGTGKEVAARFVHTVSARREKPFVAVNCAALSPELVDAALFGHERGAFTGALERRAGFLEAAGEGTLFLDEIGELGLPLQAKLLRLIETREYVRVGGLRPIPFEARLVCATNRDLAAEVARGAFREDLWYRIDVVTVRMPPLRDRPDEIGPLVERFAADAGRRLRGRSIEVGTGALAAVADYDWPGNVRELKNRVERAVALAEGERIDASDLFPDTAATRPIRPPSRSETAVGMTLADVRHAAEKGHIEVVLAATGGGLQEAATRLGISRTTLWEKMRRLGIATDGHVR